MTEHADHATQPGPGRPPRRRLRTWLLLVLGLLVLVPLLLVAALLLALRSDTGTAWVIDQIPGLTVTNDRGSLLGAWQADRLEWNGYGVDLVLEAPLVDWSPSCLFRKQLCLDVLHAERIEVTVQPAQPPDNASQQVSLPTVNLPLAIRLASVRLGPFIYNGSRIWDRFELDGGGSGAAWTIDRAFYRLDDYTVTASGRVETRRDWPVDLNVRASLPPPRGDAWTIDATLSGSVRDLMVNGRSRGYLEARLDGRLSPLDPALPARLRVDSEAFQAVAGLPATLTLKDWFVEARGSLKNGFQTRGRATLPGTVGPVSLALEGLVTTAEARNIRLTLSATPSVTPSTAPSTATPAKNSVDSGTVAVAGKVRWQGGLEASADVRLRQFPWYTLVPGLAQPPVTLTSLEGQASWREGGYQAQLQATVDGPQGNAELSTAVEGDMTQATLSDLAVVTGAGSLSGGGQLNFQGPLSWQAALNLKGFNPGYWVPALEASLSGNVTTEGQLGAGPVPDMKAQWDLSGQWRDHPALARGTLDTATGSWRLSGLELAVGDNRLTGSGAWGEVLKGGFELALPAPENFLAGLGGSAQATLDLAGTPADPQGTLTASADGLSWRDGLSVDQLALDATVQSGGVLDSTLTASGLAFGEQEIESLDVAARGTRGDHRITVDAVHEEAEVQLLFEGAAGEAWQSWQGRLASGEVQVPSRNQRWQLAEPASLAYGRDGRLTVGAHCWRWQQSSLCAGGQTLLPRPVIAYRINNVPAGLLAPVLPETLRWNARLNGEIDVSMTDAGPDGRIALDAGQGEFEVLVDGEWESLGYHTFTTELGLKPNRAQVDVRLEGPELGALTVNLSLDPTTPERMVDGSFNLDGLDIAVAGLFTGLKEVAGQVNGQGRISGPLMRPAVNGEIALTDGRLVDPRLPVPLENIVVSLDLNGYSAEISGRIRSNARSEMTLGGELEWQGAPSGEITLQGERVPFSFEPYAQLELAPDLTVAFGDGALSVTGRLGVPRGSIEIKTLPAQAVSVSEDEVVVGVEKEQPMIRTLNMDVTVVVGEDKVSFKAFGVTGNLEGTLRIGNNMDTRGTLKLVNGTYEAYGQELELRRARLLFVGNLTQPYLDIEAVREVGTVVAGIRLSGPVQSPKTEVFSNPDMPQTDALSYLILGRAPQSRGDEGQMSRAALSLGLTQASKLTGQLGEEFGIRQLTLEAEGTGDQTSVVASGYLTEDLSIRYGVGIFEPITTVAIRYDLGKYFYLEAASGLAASLDIFYTRDF